MRINCNFITYFAQDIGVSLPQIGRIVYATKTGPK